MISTPRRPALSEQSEPKCRSIRLRSLRSVDEPRGSTVGSRAQLPDHSPRSGPIYLSDSHSPHRSDDRHHPSDDLHPPRSSTGGAQRRSGDGSSAAAQRRSRDLRLQPLDLDSLRSLDPSPLASLGRRAQGLNRRTGLAVNGSRPLKQSHRPQRFTLAPPIRRPAPPLRRPAPTPLVDRRRAAPERRRVERSRAAAESRLEATTRELGSLTPCAAGRARRRDRHPCAARAWRGAWWAARSPRGSAC